MISVNWNNIRSINHSQREGFEELCCQLAEFESPKSRFFRKGKPDAGIECLAVFDDQSEWGWQAKFYTSASQIGNGQWADLDDSVKTAIEKHPNLTRYIICIPIDQPDARIPNQNSFADRWKERVTKWREWANDLEREIEFEFWGSYQLLERLSREEHRGRFLFWFNVRWLSQEWQQARYEEARDSAGPRYTPEIHVDLPIAQIFDGLGRTELYFVRLKQTLKDIQKSFRSAQTDIKNFAPNQSETCIALAEELIDQLRAVERTHTGYVPLDKIEDVTQSLLTILDEITSHLYRENLGSEQEARAIRYYVQEFSSKVRAVQQIVCSDESKLINTPRLLLTGEAGKGKTHLFCDVAKNRIDVGLPTIILMGQRFTSLEEPWTQIKQQLHLNSDTTLDDFLGALSAAAQVQDGRALILVDALNEGLGKKIWHAHLASFVQACSRYPLLGIALSVRTNFERLVIPEFLKDSLVHIKHYGFAEHEYQAAQTFFDYYKIERPSVPLLAPEFQTPLFLKILCRGLEGVGRVPRGVYGMTSIFDLFVDKVEERIWQEHLGSILHKPRAFVRKAIGKLVEAMAYARQDWINLDESEYIVNGVLPPQAQHISLYSLMVSEGILIEDTRWISGKDQYAEVTHFAYERFADHLIISHFINKHQHTEDWTAIFTDGQPLSFLLDNVGWLDALCIQVPEKIGVELPQLLQKDSEVYHLPYSFINSLIWRDPKSFTDGSRVILNKFYAEDEHFKDEILDAVLTVSPITNHPFNADSLHKHLSSFSMAERDADWSIFLHYQYGNKRAVDRLIDWAWSSADKSYLEDEAIRLCGLSLVWFFTSSHRFLRDRATKALVNLLTPRIHIVRKLIQQFREIDDLYVLERLLAVAYGCVTRSTNDHEIRLLAKEIYDWQFADGKPIPHILLRDYARGVIMYSLHRGAEFEIDLHNISPPFASEWPEIPTEDEIAQLELPGGSHASTDGSWGHNRIIWSVMDDDFARYEIGTNSSALSSKWLSLKLDEPRWRSHQDIKDDFLKNLTKGQREKWELFQNAYQSYLSRIRSMLADIKLLLTESEFEAYLAALANDDQTLVEEFLNEKEEVANYQKEINAIFNIASATEVAFINLLTDVQLQDYEAGFVNEKHRHANNKPRFQLSELQRWIVKRVFELGWRKELFGMFDQHTIGYHGRSAFKAERIGKKYQWIAFHEILAFLSDNYQYRESDYETGEDIFSGAWQIGRRDIDPTCLLKETGRGNPWGPSRPTWWFQISYPDWMIQLDDRAWLQLQNDLPDVSSLLQVVDPNGKEWLILDGHFDWQQATPPENDTYDISRRNIWYIARCHLFDTSESETIYGWATEENLKMVRLPEFSDTYEVYLGEFYWSDAYQWYKHPYYSGEYHDEDIPTKLIATCEGLLKETSTYDCSLDETYTIKLPTKLFVDAMNLHWNGVEGHFFDPDGKLIICDPSVFEKGPSVLLICKKSFISFLTENNLKPLWTIQGEKQMIGGGNQWKGRLEMRGSYRLEGDQVIGELGATFRE